MQPSGQQKRLVMVMDGIIKHLLQLLLLGSMNAAQLFQSEMHPLPFFLLFSSLYNCLVAELAAPIDATVVGANVSDSLTKGGQLVLKAASTLTSLPASIKFQLQPGSSQQRAIHKCIFET